MRRGTKMSQRRLWVGLLVSWEDVLEFSFFFFFFMLHSSHEEGQMMRDKASLATELWHTLERPLFCYGSSFCTIRGYKFLFLYLLQLQAETKFNLSWLFNASQLPPVMNAALILRGETDGSAVKGSITVKRKDFNPWQINHNSWVEGGHSKNI